MNIIYKGEIVGEATEGEFMHHFKLKITDENLRSQLLEIYKAEGIFHACVGDKGFEIELD